MGAARPELSHRFPQFPREHYAFTRARLREHRGQLPGHEQEKRLEAELGIARAGFWAAAKIGGAVHFWPRLSAGQFTVWNRLCNNGSFNRHDIGKERDPCTAKKVCRTCRAMVLALDL